MTGASLNVWLGRLDRIVQRDVVLRSLGIAGGAGVFLGLLGPFGTAGAPLWLRLIYWLILTVGGTGLGITASALIGSAFDVDDRRPFLTAGLTAVAMTPPAVLVVYGVSHWLFGARFSYGSLTEFGGPVLLVCLAMNFINALAHRRPIETHASLIAKPTPSRFLDRLPIRLRGADIHAVQAEDHYLRLHTSKGSDLILMRLSDAIAELNGVEGAQTHRSWWVAKAAVLGARRTDGRAILLLPEGVEAPVSRNYARALRAAGWF